MDASNYEQRFQTICLFILSTVAVAFALFWLRPVMLPFILALFFTLVLTPLIDIQMKYVKMPRPLALIVTLTLGIVLLSIFVILVSASVNQLAVNADSYQAQIQQMLDNVTTKLKLERFGVDAQSLLKPYIKDLGENVGGMVVRTINAIVKIFSQGTLVLIFMIFLLLGQSRKGQPPVSFWAESVGPIKRYIAAKVFFSAITGILVGSILTILGVDLALVFGLFAFLLNFIPSVGSIIATLLPLPVVLVSPELSTLSIVLAIALPGAVQFTIGNVIEPKIIGDSLKIHPVVILMALIFWGMIWGIVGMLLAVPLTAMMKIIFEKSDLTKPMADLLSGGSS